MSWKNPTWVVSNKKTTFIMKKITTIALLVLLCLNLHAQEAVRGHLLVTFKNNVAVTVDALNQQWGCTGMRSLKRGGDVYLLTFPGSADMAQLMAAYEASGLFRSVSRDYVCSIAGTPNDTLFGKQWGLNNDGSFGGGHAKAGADIDMLRAWDVEDGDSSVVVAVIDAGAKMDHAEFAGRLWVNKNEIPGNGLDDDSNGYTDDTLGWNTTDNTANLTDDNGHGTHVMGILGASVNNTTGYAGVDQHCRLMVIKAANHQGLFMYSWLVEAIYYAVDNGANVINLSAGGAYDIQELEDAVNYAYDHNVLLVAGMGNSNSSNKFYPAAYAKALAVGATNALDTTGYFSNYGSYIDVVAPGVMIYGLSHLSDTAAGVFYNGTSQATPHVTGIASLLLAQDKTRTPAQLTSLIQNNAEDLVGTSRDIAGWDKYYGYGRVNAYRALTNEALGIKQQDESTQAIVYPNPATGQV
ncbi:MAG: type sorting protein, partial [Flavipsychrobacter sp.]|nr:type sorting protein [Flavipsychrobacter sp.]